MMDEIEAEKKGTNHRSDCEEVRNVLLFLIPSSRFRVCLSCSLRPAYEKIPKWKKVWEVRDLAVLNFLTNFIRLGRNMNTI